MRVHLLAPTGFAERPSGGNHYDRQVLAGLPALGWDVATHEVSSAAEVASVVASLRCGEVVLVDSLVASYAAEVLLASRVRVVPLVHMLFETPGERELLADAPAVVVTSEWTRRQLVLAGEVDPRRVRVAVPGVDRRVPAAGTVSGGELLCVASVVRAKGLDVLLAALTRLTDLDWRCTMVGSLDLEPEFVDELTKAAADAGITDRVRFAGELARTDLAAAYLGADALVLPSRAETFGMVVTEALAHGLPVIASSVGGIAEALGQDDNGSRPGMLVRPDDPATLARGLRRWLEDPSLRWWLRGAARSRLSTLPVWSRTTAQVASALEAAR